MELFRLFGSIAIDNTNANRAINETSEEANDAKNEVSDALNWAGISEDEFNKKLAVCSSE